MATVEGARGDMQQSGGTEGRVYCFGECRFIPHRQLLLHREVPVRVGSRALDLLHALVRRPGDIVSKDELIRFAWPDIFVHEGNLKVNIASLRRALPQHQPQLPYIATVPGRGYRFVAPLRIVEPADEAAVPEAVISEAIRGLSGKLPVVPALIGRGDVMAEIADALAQTRLLTIVGPAGVGKTSMAIATAQTLGRDFKDGLCFVDLAAIEDPQLVVPAIAAALGLGSRPVHSLGGLVDILRDRDVLLVLDNCEHVLSAAASVADHLYHALQRLLIVATSREPLRCRMESVYRLAPLRYPLEESGMGAETAMRFPAVELLVRRAEGHGYRLSDEEAPCLAAISRRLDGIALAIELAAPQLSQKGAPVLLALLQHSFEPLVSQAGGATPRHVTLRATLEWSYRLLSGDEARLLRHLSVFGGTFTVDDVIEAFGQLAKAEDLAACLESLASKSLLSLSYHSGRRRYRLLDSTRSFAGECLVSQGEHRSAMAIYARYLLAVIEQAEADWDWRTREDWIERYGRWGSELRRTIDWAFGDGNDPELGVRLTAAAIPLWNELSSIAEIGARLAKALEVLNGLPVDAKLLRMKLVSARALNLNFCANLGTRLQAAWQDALRVADAAGHGESRLRLTFGWVGAQTFAGDHRATLPTLEELFVSCSAKGEHSAIPDIKRLELINRFYCGDIGTGVEGLKRLAQEHATVANRSRTTRFHLDRFVGIRSYLAPTLWVTGEHRQARAVAQEGVAAAIAIDHVISHMHALGVGAIPVSLWCGFFDVAQEQVKVLEAQSAFHQLETWLPFANFYQATIDAAAGDADAVGRMRQGIDDLKARHLRIHLPMHIAMLVQAALSHDRLDIAQEVAAGAGDYLDPGECWCAPELLRVIGLTQARAGKMQSAEQLMQRAMLSANQSGALSFELRAAISHAECARETEGADAALLRLDAVHRRFDGDFQSADLAAARVLLGIHDPLQ